MIVNTEAYTISYMFSGDFVIVDSDPGKINVQFSGSSVDPGHMLVWSHVGGTDSLYLMFSMHQNTTRLLANV